MVLEAFPVLSSALQCSLSPLLSSSISDFMSRGTHRFAFWSSSFSGFRSSLFLDRFISSSSSFSSSSSSSSSSSLLDSLRSISPLSLPNAAPSFYKRELPPSLLSFTSHEGKRVFRQALHDGAMEAYFPLAEQYVTQFEPAYCGLATLAMVLNALAIDPHRTWKGPWRWFHEEILGNCLELNSVRERGISSAELQRLARCNGLSVRSFNSSKSSLEQFRKHVKESCSRDDEPLVVHFCRATLGQTGTGHFSPIAGYSYETDMVLVCDVARFKYGSYWAPLSMLWEAINTFDEDSSEFRSYMIFQRSGEGPPRCAVVADSCRSGRQCSSIVSDSSTSCS